MPTSQRCLPEGWKGRYRIFRKAPTRSAFPSALLSSVRQASHSQIRALIVSSPCSLAHLNNSSPSKGIHDGNLFLSIYVLLRISSNNLAHASVDLMKTVSTSCLPVKGIRKASISRRQSRFPEKSVTVSSSSSRHCVILLRSSRAGAGESCRLSRINGRNPPVACMCRTYGSYRFVGKPRVPHPSSHQFSTYTFDRQNRTLTCHALQEKAER